MKSQNTFWLLLALAISFVWLFTPEGANAAQLRRSVVVSLDIVTLGDIFSDTKSAADTAVLRAPKPGKTLILSTNKLRQLAKKQGVQWTPQFGDETLTIKRLSNIIGRDEILAALEDSLAMDGYGETYEIELTSRVTPIHTAFGESVLPDVISLNIDSRGRQFNAIVAAAGDGLEAPELRVTGRLYQTELVPVLLRRIDQGETIAAADIAWRRVRVSEIRNGTVTGMNEIVGMNARRPLYIDKPVRRADLRIPILISKGSSVKMIYRSQGLVMVAIGRAVEDGAAGQEMRIMNLKSRTIVIAKATGPDTVTISRSGLIGIN
jgi:flagella basal body P-ring formation protein FlgA